MRPLQRQAAPLVIADVVSGNGPSSIPQAVDRYAPMLGEPYVFVAGVWQDDLRSAAVRCLIRYGFAKAGAVRRRGEELCDWTLDLTELEVAASLETELGGNLTHATEIRRMVQEVVILGQGPEATYLYTDSVLDALGGVYVKIGKHVASDPASVAYRVLMQYGTGNPGRPVLRYILRCENAHRLEQTLHGYFAGKSSDGIGREWFAVAVEDVRAQYEALL